MMIHTKPNATLLFVLLSSLLIWTLPSTAYAAHDEASFKVNHNPHSVNKTQSFENPIPSGNSVELLGHGTAGTNVQSIQRTERQTDPNGLISMSMPGTTTVHMTTNAGKSAGQYPLGIGGKYIPETSGGSGGSLPDWSGQDATSVLQLIVLNVDASNPNNAKVNYKVTPTGTSADSVEFSIYTYTLDGREVTLVSKTKTNVSGQFAFSFDQGQFGDTIRGDGSPQKYYINARAEVSGKSTQPVEFDMDVTGTVSSATEVLDAYFACSGVGLRGYLHGILEYSTSYEYSIQHSGKLLHSESSHASLDLNNDPITGWIEHHKYAWNGGNQGPTNMAAIQGGMGDPDSLGRHSSNDLWLQTNQNLTGFGHTTSLIYDCSGSPSAAINITNEKVDANIP